MPRLPDLTELLAAQAQRDQPAPRIPSYLKQFACPETTRVRNGKLTYRDPTGDKAVNNATYTSKQQRRRGRRGTMQP